MPRDLLHDNTPRDSLRGICPQRATSDHRESCDLSSGGACPLLPCRRGLVRGDVPHGNSAAFSVNAAAADAASSAARGLIPPYPATVALSRQRASWRPHPQATTLAPCLVPRPALPCSLPTSPCPATSSAATCPTIICASSARKGRRPVHRSHVDSRAATRARPLPVSPPPPPRPRAQARIAQHFCRLVRRGDFPRGRPRCVVRGSQSRLPSSCPYGLVRQSIGDQGTLVGLLYIIHIQILEVYW